MSDPLDDPAELRPTMLKLADGREYPVCGWCRDCRWWQLPPSGYNLMVRKPWGDCARSNEPGSLFETYSDDWSCVATAPTFGCIQYEPREGAPVHD